MSRFRSDYATEPGRRMSAASAAATAQMSFSRDWTFPDGDDPAGQAGRTRCKDRQSATLAPFYSRDRGRIGWVDSAQYGETSSHVSPW